MYFVFLSVITPVMTDCQRKRKDSLGENQIPPPGMYLPTCDDDGDYTPVQCHGSVGECWCVNANNGQEVTGTRINTRLGAVRNCSDEGM